MLQAGHWPGSGPQPTDGKDEAESREEELSDPEPPPPKARECLSAGASIRNSVLAIQPKAVYPTNPGTTAQTRTGKTVQGGPGRHSPKTNCSTDTQRPRGNQQVAVACSLYFFAFISLEHQRKTKTMHTLLHTPHVRRAEPALT